MAPISKKPTSPERPNRRLSNSPSELQLEPIDITSEERGETFVRSTAGFILEVVKVVFIALAIIIPVRYFLIQPFYVKGASMEPNFNDNEYLIINEISYRFEEPARGDIVVFRYPRNPSQFFIKRIIGLPGERVEISGGRVKIINSDYPTGRWLDESPYLAADVTSGEDMNVSLGSDEFFVMGDNRGSSLDSRRFGPIERSFIVGKTWVRAWPLSRWSTFPSPFPES